MSAGAPGPALDLEAMAVEIAQFFDNLPVAEGIGAKLRRMLHSFLEAEVLPQAEQAADLGLDPDAASCRGLGCPADLR